MQSLALLCCLFFVVGILGSFLPTVFLGLSRDFSFDITVSNKDRLVFTSQASEVQSFTFYSEGDLSDNIAFYLYGIWTDKDDNGSHWSSAETSARFYLVKTRNKLPVERYDVTSMMQNGAQTRAEQNIEDNLEKLCNSLYDFAAVLVDEHSNHFSNVIKIHANIDILLPEIPKLFYGILSKALEPFNPTIGAEMPPVVHMGKEGKPARVGTPKDFNYTWQIGEGVRDTQTLSLEYDRGIFRCIIDSTQPSFKQLISSIV